jgi:hypothetical protein
MRAARESIIGHHHIWTLYGHWLANDLRGSGSKELLNYPRFWLHAAKRQAVDRSNKVFLKKPGEIRSRIIYLICNPGKEGLPRQYYSFVVPYNIWPFHKK